MILLTVCCGCTIHRVTMRPGVSGLVVDGQTRKGIGDAQLSLADGASGELLSRKSEPDGRFCIRAKRERHVHWFGLPIEDYPFLSYTLAVQHPGYQPAATEFHSHAMIGPVSTNLAEIRLEPLPK